MTGFSSLGMLALALLLVAGPVAAQQLFQITDPADDDHGAGDILYPGRTDISHGDLDLVSLSAHGAIGGTWFVAEMANPIADPEGQLISIGAEPVNKFARNGFYTFNIDVYIDTDRKRGSGSVSALPGRKVTIRQEDAWEKAVVLTPRPQPARSLLRKHTERLLEESQRAETGRVSREDLEEIESFVETTVDERFFFPTKIRVRHKEIHFFVPTDFLGRMASNDWSYTVLVTGADIEQQTNLVGIRKDGFRLMMLPVSVGRPLERFGLIEYADAGQSPVIDLLSPDPTVQSAWLKDYDATQGRLAVVAGTVPGANYRLAAPKVSTTPARPKPAAAGIDVPVSQPPLRDASLDDLLSAPTRSNAQPGFAQRLRELNGLRDEGLISDDEYRTLRRKILSEL